VYLLHNSQIVNKSEVKKLTREYWFSNLKIKPMPGKKDYQEKLFLSFSLSGRVPEDNLHRRLRQVLDLQFVRDMAKGYYDRAVERQLTKKAKYYKTLRQSTVEPLFGTLINHTGMLR
jgi:hypothetical protein